MSYVIGVDGGASKTHALIVDRTGKFMGFGAAGTGNHQSRGLEKAVFEIRTAVTQALHQADLDSENATSKAGTACFCLAGADLKADYIMLQEAMESLDVAQKVVIKNDTMAALRAGLTHSWGVVIICGTGFNAAARGPDGREIVLPGLGATSGDWGGGWALSQEVIRHVMRAWDGRGQPTTLTQAVLKEFDLPSEEALLETLYHHKIDSKRLHQLVPLLFRVADQGDPVARRILISLGIEVGVTANALIRRLEMQDLEVEVILAGGVFKGQGTLLIDTAREKIREEAPKAIIRRQHYEPVVGAALLALEASGADMDANLLETLDETLPDSLKLREKA